MLLPSKPYAYSKRLLPDGEKFSVSVNPNANANVNVNVNVCCVYSPSGPSSASRLNLFPFYAIFRKVYLQACVYYTRSPKIDSGVGLTHVCNT